MTAVNRTSKSLTSVCIVQCTPHAVFVYTNPLVTCCLLRHVFYCLFCARACCRGRTHFHRALRAPLVHVSKHDTAALVTYFFPLCSPCMSKVCRIGVMLHLKTRPNAIKGISAARSHGFYTRSKSQWSNFIIGGISYTHSLSLGQTEGLSG